MTGETPQFELPPREKVDGASGSFIDAVDFLREMRPGGPWTLTQIHEGRILSETFDDTQRMAMGKWVRDRNNRVNLYWHINRTYEDPGNKAALEDVSHLERLHVDIDPDPNAPGSIEEQRATILALLQDEAKLKAAGIPGLPTKIVDSGGGYWAFWNLAEPTSLNGATEQERRENAHRAGGHNKWIADQLNTAYGIKFGDACHNVDRVGRLAGTLNIPSAKKRAAGRMPALSALLKGIGGGVYELGQFGWSDNGEAGPCREAVADIKIEKTGWSPLPKDCNAWDTCQELLRRYPDVRPRTIELLLLGDRLDGDELKTKIVDGEKVVDRSTSLDNANHGLQHAGVPLGLIVEILSDERLAISEHLRFPANGDGKQVSGGDLYRAASKQVQKCAARMKKKAFDAAKAAKALDGEEPAPETTPPKQPTPSEHPPAEGKPKAQPAPGQLPAALRFEHGPGKNGKAGPPLKSERNILVALKRLSITLSYNSFADRLIIDGLEGFGPELNDAAVIHLWLLIDRQFGFRPAKDYFFDVLTNQARVNQFHPVLDYLDALVWDKVPRLDNWLITYGGAKDTPYVRAVSGLIMMASVRRLRRPGCKFDEMPVLEGPQGTNKSSALKIIAVNEDWFTDDLPLGSNSKVMIEQMGGKWIVEIADLHKKKSADVNEIKAQLSRTEDRARLSYARTTGSVKRQCVFFGTTNDDKYLNDPTGDRRFWPVYTQKFDLDGLKRDRDQLWAEAAQREAADESIRLDPELWAEAAKEQSERSVVDPWLEMVSDILSTAQGRMSCLDAWVLVGVPVERRDQKNNARLGRIMRQLGFDRTKARIGGEQPVWCYTRGKVADRITVERGTTYMQVKVGKEVIFSEGSRQCEFVLDTMDMNSVPF